MSTVTEKTVPITAQEIYEQAHFLTPADLRWLTEQLNQLVDHDIPRTSDWDNDNPLPENATLDEAIELFLADQCSLGRAAELADVTRWDIQDILKERGIPIYGGSEMTIEQMYDQIESFENRGIL